MTYAVLRRGHRLPGKVSGGYQCPQRLSGSRWRYGHQYAPDHAFRKRGVPEIQWLLCGEVTAAMAHGALLGARGNSGVILSQFFHGLAQGLRDKERFDGGDLAQALMLASRAAYSSVSKPVDGTMLTVIRELSLAASHHVGSRGALGTCYPCGGLPWKRQKMRSPEPTTASGAP